MTPRRFIPNDSVARAARQRGFRSRSALKIEELLRRFPDLLPAKARIVDVGCAPGGFLQVFSAKKPATLVGIDLLETVPVAGARLLVGDVFDEKILEKLCEDAPFSVFSSDAAPKTTGTPDVDSAASVALCRQLMGLFPRLLAPQGNALIKVFMGEDFPVLQAAFKRQFTRARAAKPAACRERSRETYLLGWGYRPSS